MNSLGEALEKAFHPDTETGGKRSAKAVPGEITTPFRGIGVLYAKDCGATVEFRLLYESHTPQDIKDIVSELFGIGAIQWNVCK